MFLGRAVIFLLVGLTLVYGCLFFYLRAGARMRLEEDWAHAGRPGNRDDWVDERVGPAVRRIRVLLTIFVYAVPIVGVTAFVWLSN
ncbi:hypothetical protein V8J82_10550 [Gymnodinialimonas sp. 2305UL16-5]|uniref:hypothetical protein n=1 Tax=Gymnodinialimonas mytili TaxID=3126503 RepID=UPI0030A81BB9